jgi:hypothetical protein
MKAPIEMRQNILTELSGLDIDGVWKLRGNVNVLKNYVIKQPDGGNNATLKNIEDLLQVSNDFYKFLINIKGNVTSADFNRLARIFNTSGDAALAIEEIISKEDVKIPELVLSGLSMVLTYVGDTAYISSALENCENTVAANSIIVYDRLWSLIHDYRETPSSSELGKINAAMNTFFNLLPNKDVSLTERILVITRMYQLMCMIYTAGIISNIKWESDKAKG